jgi:ADP-ribose pyrophosphatase YjhB (NUDIX family)
MIRNSYARLGRLAHGAATPLLRMYMKGKRRVRTVVVNNRGEILLVRSWFGHQRWSLPGGGLKRGEPPQSAAIRETLEETGVALDQQRCKFLGEFANGDSNAPFIVECFVATVDAQPAHIAARHRLEMLDVAWFPLDQLPALRSSTVDRALELYLVTSKQ